MGEFAVGQGVSRFEDPRLVCGGGRYVDDIKLPGMAHAVVARSPHAHAKIKSIDISAAKVASGVLAVLTAADVKAAGYGDLPVPGGLKRRDGSPMYKPRYPLLSSPTPSHKRRTPPSLSTSNTRSCPQSLQRPRPPKPAHRACGTIVSTISASSN
jgi:hypothetical protein